MTTPTTPTPLDDAGQRRVREMLAEVERVEASDQRNSSAVHEEVYDLKARIELWYELERAVPALLATVDALHDAVRERDERIRELERENVELLEFFRQVGMKVDAVIEKQRQADKLINILTKDVADDEGTQP